MTAASEMASRRTSHSAMLSLEDRFEVLREIGDGSFGSVALARVRTAGANVARRGTLVAIKTMKNTFESFTPCLELREVVFLRTLPAHLHLVPALDIFLDPFSKRLHICMEYMDGNLYQLMKAREHKSLDGSNVKSILYQILCGLEHIHANNFFHRDIKPENILVSTSSSLDGTQAPRRYSSLMTPPSTPSYYTIKIADFGLAREIHSHLPYTTYVSTRWYRAPEVLLRAGEYSAPVDMWALGAMAVEIANLKPLFPGGNEVDQVWRVCEIMGSPGNWYDKDGHKVGGGEWREGTRLAQKLGFSFPKMAPHSMETILRTPQWPTSLSHFVTWCLMWDPRSRPTASDAMKHEYFADAIDPLRPRSRTSVLGSSKKHASVEIKPQRDSSETPSLTTSRSSWFRKSIGRDHSLIPQPSPQTEETPTLRPALHHNKTTSTDAPQESSTTSKYRPFANKRATWTNGTTAANAAPMPILPSIRPISPFSNTVTALAQNSKAAQKGPAAATAEVKPSRKIGRQLSVQSNGNHYADLSRQDPGQAPGAPRGVVSPTGEPKESFFSHLRKRARRLSGKPSVTAIVPTEDVSMSNSQSPRQSKRNSMITTENPNVNNMDTILERSFENVDRALQAAQKTAVAAPAHRSEVSLQRQAPGQEFTKTSNTTTTTTGTDRAPLERQPSLSKSASTPSLDGASAAANLGASSARARWSLNRAAQPDRKHDVLDEEDELLHEALTNAHSAVRRLDRRSHGDITKSYRKENIPPVVQSPVTQVNRMAYDAYPTPSPSAKRNGILFDHDVMAEAGNSLKLGHQAVQPKETSAYRWPTPPYEENEWAASASASIFAAGSNYR